MTSETKTATAPQPRRLSSLRSFLGKALLHTGSLAIAVAAFVGYEHFKAAGNPIESLASLLAAAGFGLTPVRELTRQLFALEGKVLHLVHGLGSLAILGLSLSGVVSGRPLLSQAALAPFTIMGAAQAVMHQDHPRDAKQAQALRSFAASLPEVEQFTKSGDLASPENAARAVAVLSDILAKAELLGQTELRSDPGFQGALHQTMTRFGLSLGLDSVGGVLDRLAASPSASGSLPELRARLTRARKSLE